MKIITYWPPYQHYFVGIQLKQLRYILYMWCVPIYNTTSISCSLLLYPYSPERSGKQYITIQELLWFDSLNIYTFLFGVFFIGWCCLTICGYFKKNWRIHIHTYSVWFFHFITLWRCILRSAIMFGIQDKIIIQKV